MRWCCTIEIYVVFIIILFCFLFSFYLHIGGIAAAARFYRYTCSAHCGQADAHAYRRDALFLGRIWSKTTLDPFGSSPRFISIVPKFCRNVFHCSYPCWSIVFFELSEFPYFVVLSHCYALKIQRYTTLLRLDTYDPVGNVLHVTAICKPWRLTICYE